MEEKKLIKRKQKAEEKENRRQLAEACFDLGDHYNLKHLYERALKEYKESAFIYKKMGVSLDTAKAHRMVGEMYMMLGEFKKALTYEETYLSLAKQLDNKTEEQRALATLGRAYLLQGQSSSDSNESTESLKLAEKAFTKSLVICESLKGKINNIEFMDMRARLLLNIGVVLEHLSSLDKAIEFINRAINISKCNDFYDLLHQCYLTEGVMYLSKRSDFSNALLCFNLAIEVATRLENKALKQCEALSLKADVLCKMSDFHSAKQTLLKAWKLKTPDENEFKEIERKLKTVAALCYTEDLIITTDSNDFGVLKNLYERLGDGACSLKNFKKGIDYYLKMLENAEKYGDSDKQLIPIYVSLYQTYLDLEDYTNALKYYMKELNIIKDNPSEASNTYLGIAEVLQKAGKDILEIESTYKCAVSEAQKTTDTELKHKVEKKFLKFHKRFKPSELESFKQKYNISVSNANPNDSSSDDEGEKTDLSQNTPDIGDDICIENITDVSDVDEDEENSKPKSVRKRGKGFSIKKNSKGETQLHQACISGNTLLVTRLISQGHPVNVRDNAGWLPLHEACIHGHKDIVETLLKHNAHYNDRGGVQCDGITPMHDAASNGHLDIVELLLDFGASSSIKTDGGETVLDTLQQWRKRVKLTTVDHIFYETLCSKLHKNLDKIVQISPKKSDTLVTAERNLSMRNSVTPIKQTNLRRTVNDDDDNSDSSNSIGKYKLKRNSILSDASSDDSSDSIVLKKPNPKLKKSGVSEYKNAMKALRSRTSNSTSDIFQETITEKRKKTAILDTNEVGEDWLDDDFKDFQNKKPRKKSHSPIKRKSNESLKSRNKSLEDVSNPTIANNDYSATNDMEIQVFDENVSCNNIIDSDDFSDNTLTHNSIVSLTSKQNKKAKIWKHQSSLIKSGFTRHKMNRPGFEGYQSDGESVTNVSICSYNSNKSKTEEPDSTSEPLLLNKTSFLDKSNSNIKTANLMDNIIPPMSIKVKILEKLLLIPISAEKMNTSTVDWLINEASKRYYKLEGVKPVFSLMTSDGAILTEDDPLSIVINSGDLYASIKNWNLPPLIERYVEYCSHLQTSIEDNVKEVLESGDSTNVINFSDFNLEPHQCHPIFKSLCHQSALTHLILNNNILGNDSMVQLSSCLPTLKGLTYLDLKNNYIQSNGMKHLYEAYEKQCQEPTQRISFDLSYNPINTTGFLYILKLSRYILLKKLFIKSCDINEDVPSNVFESAILNQLQDLDISLNQMSSNNIHNILNKIDAEKIESLKMAETKISNNEIMQSLIQCSFTNLRSIDLSRCNLIDSDIYQLLRILQECDNICDVSLCYNEELTFLSLKRLLTHRPIEKLNLIGCDQIFKHMGDLDLQTNWFTLSESCKLSSVLLSTDSSNVHKIDALKKMWLEYNNEKGKIMKRYNSVEFLM